MPETINVEQLESNREELRSAVNSLISRKATLEDELESTKLNLASNNGALQYVNTMIDHLNGNGEGGASDIQNSDPHPQNVMDNEVGSGNMEEVTVATSDDQNVDGEVTL